MARQKPPESTGKLTGIPYGDLWEESGESWERLYDHGYDRDLIDRSFEKARQLGAEHLCLTVQGIELILTPLALSHHARAQLAEKLYYFAGHYYSPRFHKLFGDAPTDARRLLRQISTTAAKLDSLMSRATPSVWRQVGAARLRLHRQRRANADLEWSRLQDYVADLARSAKIIADEFPVAGRGMSERVLQARWLRHSVEAIQQACGRDIVTKVSDSAGANFRCEGTDGQVLETYCRAVDKGIASATIVQAVRAFQEHGIPGSP